jgi:hypothetical protein
LAQPFRLLGHNGEINTIRGNRQWMESRESVLKSDQLGNLQELYPIVQPGMSDSATLDNVLEFLVMSGKSLPHAMAMLVPESWNQKNPISDNLRAFYEYHSTFMEPWDGPATLLFSDGRYAGGMLDRNGLRPARYLVTHDNLMIIASETGTIEFEPSRIKEKGRLKPGKMLIHTTSAGTQGIVNASGATEILTGSLVNAAAIARYIKASDTEEVSLVAMGWEGKEVAPEDVLCARYIKSFLEGTSMDMEKELSMLRETPSGAKFFKPETQDVFPEGDYWMCTGVDRFDFVLKVSQLEKDIFEVKRIDI